MAYHLTLKHIEPVTHDTYLLVFDRPDGFDYAPGQGMELHLLKEGLEEGRPLTPVTLPEEPTLELSCSPTPIMARNRGHTDQMQSLFRINS